MGRFTAPGTSPARGYIDDGTPSGRRFVFELPGDGWPPRTVDLLDPPGSATPGRVRCYRSVGRRRGYVYLYVFEEMPGVYPGADPVDPPTEPALPVVPEPDVADDPDAPEQHRRRVLAALWAREGVQRQAARRRKAARRRETERRPARRGRARCAAAGAGRDQGRGPAAARGAHRRPTA